MLTGLLLSIPGYFKVVPGCLPAFYAGRILPAAIASFMPALCLAIAVGASVFSKRIWLRIPGVILLAMAALLSMAEMWTLFNVYTRMTERVLNLVLLTSSSEASEYLGETLFTTKSLAVLLCYIVLTPVLAVLAVKAGSRLERLAVSGSRRRRRGIEGGVAVLILVGAIAGLTVRPWIQEGESVTERFFLACSQIPNTHKWIKMLEAAAPSADGRLLPDAERPERIMWVIGESDMKSRSQLYGYRMPTMPLMDSLMRRGNLIVFRDVMCHTPWTDETMKLLFSPALPEASDSVRWTTPLLPMLLRKAGYNVRMFDNQSTFLKAPTIYDIGANEFINTPLLNRASFDWRNDELERYDDGFIRRYGPKLREHSWLQMDIVHLYGQHQKAAHRLPPGREYFTPADYGWRRGLSDAGKSFVAAYDNATRYLDANLADLAGMLRDEDAVMVYISDHGDLVCDVDERIGREYANVTDPEIARYFLEIPMYVYVSDRFKALHPGLYERLLEASREPFSTAWMSHFLLDLAGVGSRWRRPVYSPLSPEWAAPTRTFWQP